MNHQTVCARLLHLMEDLERTRDKTPRDLWRTALNLEHFVLSDLLSEEEEEAVLADPRVDSKVAACQDLFRGLETMIEQGMARVVEIVGVDAMWDLDNVGQHYIARYEHLARKEIELAGICGADRVLFIGSGPLPITAFEYARQTGCSVDGVDYVPEAVECSQRIAERVGLTHRVRLCRARGETHDPSPYDVILVGVLAMPKQPIMNHLNLNVKQNCRIICRTTFGLRQLIYQRATFDAGDLHRLLPKARSVARGDRVISAELLVAS